MNLRSRSGSSVGRNEPSTAKWTSTPWRSPGPKSGHSTPQAARPDVAAMHQTPLRIQDAVPKAPAEIGPFLAGDGEARRRRCARNFAQAPGRRAEGSGRNRASPRRRPRGQTSPRCTKLRSGSGTPCRSLRRKSGHCSQEAGRPDGAAVHETAVTPPTACRGLGRKSGHSSPQAERADVAAVHETRLALQDAVAKPRGKIIDARRRSTEASGGDRTIRRRRPRGQTSPPCTKRAG